MHISLFRPSDHWRLWQYFSASGIARWRGRSGTHHHRLATLLLGALWFGTLLLLDAALVRAQETPPTGQPLRRSQRQGLTGGRGLLGAKRR